MTKRNLNFVVALTVLLIAALYFTYWLGIWPSAETVKRFAMATQQKVFVCPMHPEIVQDHPGVCPICGMKLVEADERGIHEHGIRVDGATIQRLGIRLAGVKRGVIAQTMLAYGNIEPDARTLYNVYPKYDGWIRKLYVHSVGERVRADQVLYEIYSPDLIAREKIYLSNIDQRKQVLQTIPTTASTENEYVMDLTLDAARDRNRLHSEEGVSIETIQQMEDKRQVPDISGMIAGHFGVIAQLNAREGSFVSASTSILTLADVSHVWVNIPLYPDQAAYVRVGDPVAVHAPDGKELDARVDFISPLADSNKVTIRVYIHNDEYKLRPGSYADVTINAHPRQALVLPRSAILYTAQGNFVMLSRGEGGFLPVPVETGAESGDIVEIVSGLREGAEVAVNGQFLLDASSSMNAATERMRKH